MKILTIDDFCKGDQITYVPMHARGNLNHIDVEDGFVTSVNRSSNTVFCRYWRKESINHELRTKANSEGCSPEFLIKRNTVTQERVDILLAKLYPGGDL